MYRKTWFEINLDAIEENVKYIKQKNKKKFIAVLKANAYGCGDIQVAQAVLEAGADMIAVSSVEEALSLRKEGYEGELLILGTTNPSDLQVLKEYHITTNAYSLEWVKKVIQLDCKGLKVHLKVDTGMNRIGSKSLDDTKEMLELLVNHGCKVEGIFTHFACADSNTTMTQTQFQLFKDTVESLDYSFEWIHCDNSDASVSLEEDFSNACRVGISLYGISAYEKSLKHALSFYTTLVHVKKVQPNETIGYGATYTTEKEEWIGTIPVGYADGFIRANQDRYLLCNDQLCRVVGRVCMDQAMILLPEKMEVGSIVEIFGPHLSLEKMAEDLHTIPYEIICLISPRVTRRYIKNHQVIREDNVLLELHR